MLLQDFVKNNNVEYEAVRVYIKRHGLETVKDAKGRIILPDETVKQLEEKYQKEQPVQVIEDQQLLKKVIELQERVIGLQDKLQQTTEALAHKTASEGLLEAQKADLEQTKKEMHQLKAENASLRQKANESAAEVERLKHRSLWERIRNI